LDQAFAPGGSNGNHGHDRRNVADDLTRRVELDRLAQVKVDLESDYLSLGHGERGLNVNGGPRVAERDAYGLDGRVLGRIVDDHGCRLKGYCCLVVRPFSYVINTEDG